MEDIINILLSICVTVLLVRFCIKKCMKSNSHVEKAIYVAIPFMYSVIAIIYLLDRYNIPSLLKWDVNVSSSQWFNFITTCASTIIGAFIGGIIIIFVTIKQLKVQVDSDNNDKRIQNAPILKYDITNIMTQTENQFFMFNSDDNNYNLFINVENVGLNHARNINFEISGSGFKNKQVFSLNNAQSILKKDNSIWLQIIFNYSYDKKTKKHNNKEIKIIVFYEDLLKNHYSQEIKLHLEATNEYGSIYGGYKFYVNLITIEDETYLDTVREVK